MALDKQIHIYSVDTGNFYTNHEARLHRINAKIRAERKYLKVKLNELKNFLLFIGYSEKDIARFKSGNINKMTTWIPGSDDILREYHRINQIIKYKGKAANKIKDRLLLLLENKVKQNEFTNGKDHCRELRPETVNDNNIVSIFDSSLIRTIGIEQDKFSDSLMVVQVYYFDVFKDLSYFGFTYCGEKYQYFTSSAGQIRKKKAVFIKKSIWDKHEKTIMCGLTIDKINEKGGNNVNKHLAYMALTNSATDEWVDFDIDRTIVIDDFETDVFGTYDLIDENDYSITRKTGYVPISHTDGAGLVLDGVNRMARLPWIKGLLGVFDYVSLINEKGWSPKIKDIYGKEYDVIEDNIRVIFTKSQFKMWKYYDSWDEYKTLYKENHCSAGVCNVEEERIKNATINYQMLQTLTNVTDEELLYICSKSITKLNSLGSSLESIFNIFGITPYNNNMTALQKAVKIYPDLLNDEYMKTVIREIKDSLIKSYKSGKLEVNGKYTFLLPDYYAACEYWFGHIENPKGLLSDGEVYCNLFKINEELDCLRSPHLFKEHAIRKNKAYDEWKTKTDDIGRWFKSKAIYTSCQDLISKVLQFDVDGDKSLVVADQGFIEIVKKNMRGIVPLYYNMRKAAPQLLSNKTIYAGLNAAFVGGNIGLYSNDISKIWNSEVFISGTIEEQNAAIDIVRLLCMENNFVIDYAKTLYKPERPKDKNQEITAFTKSKVPAFFMYAKDKEVDKVESKNLSTVNRISDLIPNPKLRFKSIGLNKPDYRFLMNNPYQKIDQQVIDMYSKENKEYHFKINMKDEDCDNLRYIACKIRESLSSTGYTDIEICDMLVKYLYGKQSKNKEALWFCYGNIIVDNLMFNLKPSKLKLIQCVDCGEWFEEKNISRRIRCNSCEIIERKRIKHENYIKNKN